MSVDHKAMNRVWKQHTGSVAWPTLLLVAVLFVCSASLVALGVLRILPLWVAGALLVPVAYGWFTPLHEAVHGNIGGSRRHAWLDTAIGWLSALAFVAPYPAFRAVHLRHHGVANKPGKDPDLWVAGANPLTIALRCLTIVPHYYWMFVTELRTESAQMAQAVRQAAAAVLFFAVASGVAVWAGFGAELLALWVFPGVLASGWLAFAFDWLPHHPHGKTGRFDNARILEGGPVLSVLMAGQDAHLIHHLWPKVPFYRYHAVLREVRPMLEAEQVRFEGVLQAPPEVSRAR
jgi:fatty acid desaturase